MGTEKKEEFEIERLIPVNVLRDKKQMRITIPAEIVEDFRIDPNRHQFAWIVQKEINSNKITIAGKFVFQPKNDKEKN